MTTLLLCMFREWRRRYVDEFTEIEVELPTTDTASGTTIAREIMVVPMRRVVEEKQPGDGDISTHRRTSYTPYNPPACYIFPLDLTQSC